MVRRLDDIARVRNALASIGDIDDPVRAAAVLAYSVSRAQAFGEGNKRTALLLDRWVLDGNGQVGAMLLSPDDHQLADLLIQAAAGTNVETDIVSLLSARAL